MQDNGRHLLSILFYDAPSPISLSVRLDTDISFNPTAVARKRGTCPVRGLCGRRSGKQRSLSSYPSAELCCMYYLLLLWLVVGGRLVVVCFVFDVIDVFMCFSYVFCVTFVLVCVSFVLVCAFFVLVLCSCAF